MDFQLLKILQNPSSNIQFDEHHLHIHFCVFNFYFILPYQQKLFLSTFIITTYQFQYL